MEPILVDALPPKTRISRRQVITRATIATIVALLTFFSGLYLLSPLSATVTLVPFHQQLSGQYSVSVVTQGATAPGFVKGRLITFTGPGLSKTVAVTGKGHTDAVSAKGMLLISNILLYDTSPNQYLEASEAITANNGIVIVTDTSVPLAQGGSQTVAAHAQQAGPSGNIGANIVNADYDIVAAPALPNSSPTGRAHISNPAAFGGGAIARNFAVVQQADIDGAAAAITPQLQAAAQQGVQRQAQQSLQATESLVSATPACTSAITSNHNAQDEAINVTVQVTMSCTLTAYQKTDLATALTYLQSGTAQTQLGSGFGLVGDILYDPLTGTTAHDGSGTIQTAAKGVWSYGIDAIGKQNLAKLIGGRSPDDAQKALDHHLGIQNASIVAHGFGHVLTHSAKDIIFVVPPVAGLKAGS